MNIIRIEYNQKIKKIMLKEEHKNLQNFNTIISEVSQLNPSNYNMFFFDVEEDKIQIEDQHDLDYFLE